MEYSETRIAKAVKLFYNHTDQPSTITEAALTVPAAEGRTHHERLVCLLDNPDDQRYVVLVSDTCETLHDLTTLTAYNAWQLLGARRVNGRRVPSNMFKIICDHMTALGLTFTDTPPCALYPYTRQEVEQQLDSWNLSAGAITKAARLMANFHLNDFLLKQLSDSEIHSLQGAGDDIQLFLRVMRKRLRQV